MENEQGQEGSHERTQETGPLRKDYGDVTLALIQIDDIDMRSLT